MWDILTIISVKPNRLLLPKLIIPKHHLLISILIHAIITHLLFASWWRRLTEGRRTLSLDGLNVHCLCDRCNANLCHLRWLVLARDNNYCRHIHVQSVIRNCLQFPTSHLRVQFKLGQSTTVYYKERESSNRLRNMLKWKIKRIGFYLSNLSVYLVII